MRQVTFKGLVCDKLACEGGANGHVLAVDVVNSEVRIKPLRVVTVSAQFRGTELWQHFDV